MTQIIEMLVPKGTNARPGLALTPQYITIHNTANTARGAGAVSHGKYLQGAGSAKYVSYHYAVDDTAIVRILPENEVAWPSSKMIGMPTFQNEASPETKTYFLGFNGDQDTILGVNYSKMIVGTSETLKDANNATQFKIYKYNGYMHIWNATSSNEEYIAIANGANGAADSNFTLPNGAKLENVSSQAFFLWSSAEQDYRIMLGVRDNLWTLCPDVNNNVYLGTYSSRWNKLFCSCSPDVGSDRRLKKDIIELDEKYSNFILGLQACKYALISDTSGKTHMGFIAQDVESLMNSLGIDALSYGIINKNQKYNDVQVVEDYWDEDLEDVSQHIRINSITIDGEYEYSLCYEEFIPSIVKTIQIQKKEIDSLKSELEKYSLLEERIKKIEEKLI